MNIQLIYPEHLQDWVGDGTKRPEKIDEFNYIGISIEERHGHYYYAKGVCIPISAREQNYIRTNPKLYYFSTALKLHHRIERLRDLADGL